MREIRLFVDAPLTPGQTLPLPREAGAHAVRVLRLKAGDGVILFNGDGREYPARLVDDAPRTVNVRVEDMHVPGRESPLHITLVQALARGEKMDWIIQKATELGVARIWPVTSERSEVRLDGIRGDKRLQHWRAVAIAACEQCGRNVVPEIRSPESLAAMLIARPSVNTETRWMLHPSGATRLRDAAPASANLLLAIGPEGGFGDTDLAALRGAGFGALALGPRVMRTETAGLAAIAALQARYGDF